MTNDWFFFLPFRSLIFEGLWFPPPGELWTESSNWPIKVEYVIDRYLTDVPFSQDRGIFILGLRSAWNHWFVTCCPSKTTQVFEISWPRHLQVSKKKDKKIKIHFINSEYPCSFRTTSVCWVRCCVLQIVSTQHLEMCWYMPAKSKQQTLTEIFSLRWMETKKLRWYMYIRV